MMHEFEDRDDPKPPHPWRNFALMTGATIAVVFLIVNVIRGLTGHGWNWRSEEHTSELQSLMRISYAVFCLKKKKRIQERKGENGRCRKKHKTTKRIKVNK